MLIQTIEIRAVGLHKHVFCGKGIGTVKTDFYLDVVEHTNLVVNWVIADRLNAHSTYLDATHDTVDAHSNHRL